MIDHLRNTLHCDKVTLAGHSWGGTVGLLYSQAHPEMVRALFAVNPLIATADGERAKFAFVLASAEARKDARVLEQIKKLNERRPLIDLDQPLQLDRLVDRYGGLFHRRPEKVWVALHALALGLTTPTDLLNIIRGNNISLQAMQKELLPLDLRRTVPRLETPVVFLVGRFDHQTDSGITANYFDSLACTDKRLFWFENSAHNVPFEEPERFDDTIVQGFESITKGTAGAN